MILAVIFVFWLLAVEFRVTGGRHTPALYFLLYMCGLMIICEVLAGITPFSIAGFFFLAVVTGTFWLGHLAGALVLGQAGMAPTRSSIFAMLETPIVRQVLMAALVAGVVAGVLALAALWQAGRSAGVQVSSLADLAKFPAYFSAVRYTSGAEDAEPLAVRFFMLILEAGSMSAGLLRFGRASRFYRYTQLAPLVVAFLLTLMTGERSYLFLNCTWFFGTYVALLCVEGSVFTGLREPRFLLRAALLLAVGFLFGSSFAILRYSAQELQTPTVDQFIAQLLPIMASSLAAIVTATIAFDQMVEPGVALHLGAYSFAPVTAWLGLESIRYPPTVFLTNGLSDSNQYSLTGFLLIDFGPTLTALIFFVTGALAAASIYFLRAGLIVALPLLIAIMCVVFFSLIGNFFFFTTHVALFLVMTVACIALQILTARSAAQ